MLSLASANGNPPPSRAVAYASEMCDVLNQDLFSACHEHLSPTAFHRQCRSDTCKCGTPCLCSSLAHYAHHCRRFSVVIDFRSQVPDCGEFSAKSHLVLFSLYRSHVFLSLFTTIATTCPPTMQYGTCVSSCQSRCSALSVPQHCGEDCEEGCVCPSGTFYNHRTQTCVQRYCRTDWKRKILKHILGYCTGNHHFGVDFSEGSLSSLCLPAGHRVAH